MEKTSQYFRFTLLWLLSAVFVLAVGFGLIRMSSRLSPVSTTMLAVPVAILWPGVFGAIFFGHALRSFCIGYVVCGGAYLHFALVDSITWFWMLQPVFNTVVDFMRAPRGGPPGSADYVFATVHLLLLSVIALVGGLLGYIFGRLRRPRFV